MSQKCLIFPILDPKIVLIPKSKGQKHQITVLGFLVSSPLQAFMCSLKAP